MEAKLVVVGGKANMGEVKLRLPMTIGRGHKADLIISHPTVSRIHCELYEVDGALIIRDNGSSNGTFIDDKQIKEAVVEPGHILKIGPLTFRAEYDWAGNAPSLDAMAEGRALAATQTMTADELFGDEEPPSVATSPPSKPLKKESEQKSPQPSSTKAKTGRQADEAAQAPVGKSPTKQPAAQQPAEKDEFDFMADIEFVDDGAQAEPVGPPHETVEVPADIADDGVDLLDDLDLDVSLEAPSPVELPEPSAETVAASPEPAETFEEPGFDFLANLDAPAAESAMEAESPAMPSLEEPIAAESPVEELAATQPTIAEPPAQEVLAEAPSFDFLDELETHAPTIEADLKPEPVAELEPIAEPEPVAEQESEPEPELPRTAAADLEVTAAFDFDIETDSAMPAAAPSFDFLDETEPTVAEPVAPEPPLTTPPADDEAPFDMFLNETAPSAEAEPPAAPATAENETPAAGESPWNIELPNESALETTQPFVLPAPPETEAAAPSSDDEAFSPPVDEFEPTVDFRSGDDESVGKPAFAFGPSVDETPSAEMETIEPVTSFAAGENNDVAPIVAPPAKSSRPAPTKKPSFIDKLKMLLAGSGKKTKGPKVKPTAKQPLAPADASAATGTGPIVPMFSPSQSADDPIPLADELFAHP